MRGAFAAGKTLPIGAAPAVGAASTPTNPNPSNGQVVSGSGNIAQSGNTTTITQNSDVLSLTWDSFDIGADSSVTFLQPSELAIAINRILGNDASQILGRLDANGRVFLINPNGVLFGEGAQVNVGGLVASTLDFDDSELGSGTLHFEGDSSAAVVNKGALTAANGGYIALLGHNVSNQGVISARLGTVALAGGNAITLNFEGAGLAGMQVERSQLDALVENRQLIVADGGQVLMTAGAKDSLLASVVNNTGVVQAHGVSTEGGVVRLLAAGGDVVNSGSIDVSGTRGGSVELLSDQDVMLLGGTRINASGTLGGGRVRIGGGFQGGEGLQAARRTYVDVDAAVRADAGTTGDGGEVIVWADEVTIFHGNISATGGAQSGDGGFAEVSGKKSLGFAGTVDLTAPNGATGTLLLDPADVLISDTSPSPQDSELGDNNIFDGDGTGTFTLSDEAIEASVNTANTSITATNSITQQAGAEIDLSVGAQNMLTLQTTSGDITLNASLIGSGAKLVLNAGGSIRANAGASVANTGDIALTALVGVDLSAAPVMVGGALLAQSLGGEMDLGNAGNDFSGRVDAFAFSGMATLVDQNTIQLGSVFANSLGVTAGGSITDIGGAFISVTGMTSLTATDSVALDSPSNDFRGAVDALTGSFVKLVDANDITLRDVQVGTTLSVTATEIDLVSGVTGFTVLNGGVTLINSGGDTTRVGGVDSATTGDFRVSQDDLDRITSDELRVQSGGGNIGVHGADADAFALVQLDAGTGDITFATASSNFADLLVADLASDAVGADSVSQTATVTVSGDTRFNVTNDVTLAMANDFASSVDVIAGGNATVNDVSATGLGEIDVGGNLTVAAGGTITDTLGEAIKVAGATYLLASDGTNLFDIALDNGLHDFDEDITGDALTFLGKDVTLTDIDRLTLGASTATGTLDLTARDFDLAGTVTVGGGTGTATLTAPFFIFSDTIDAPGTDADLHPFGTRFTSADAANLDSGVATFADTGALAEPVVFLDFDSGTAIGDIVVNSTGDIEFGEPGFVTTFTSLFRGDLTLNAGDDVRQTTTGGSDVSLTVQGATSISADAVTLDDVDNDFQGVVAVDASSAALADANAIVLDDLEITNDLAVIADGAITQAGILTVVGASTFDAGISDITLTNVGNDFTGAVGLTGGATQITDMNALTLASVQATSLDATSGGNLGQSDAWVVTDDSSLDAGGAITVANAGNDFADEFSGSTLALEATGDITIRDANSLALGTVTGANLSVTATDVATSGTVSITGTAGFSNSASDGMALGVSIADGSQATFEITDVDLANIEAADVSLTTAGNGGNGIEVQGATLDNESLNLDAGIDGVSFTTAATTVGGDLFVNSGTTVRQHSAGSFSVLGTTDIVAGNAVDGFSDVFLNNAGNDFGGVLSVTGGDMWLVDSNNIVLGGIEVNDNTDSTLSSPFGGALQVVANGSITDTVASRITVQGAAQLLTTGSAFEIALDQGAHDFDFDGTGDAVHASGSDISLSDVNSIELGLVSATGGLTVEAGGGIAQNAWGVTVSGASIFDAGTSAIALTDAGNDFGDVVSLTGGNVQITDANALTLGSLNTGALTAVNTGALDLGSGTVTGNLVATSNNGAISQTGALEVFGTSTIDAGSGAIILTDAGNDFVGSVSLDGNGAQITDVDLLTLGSVQADNLSAIGGDDIVLNGPVTSTSIDLNANSAIAINTDIVDPATSLTLEAGTSISAQAIDVASFTLQGGSWSQVAASLPTFNATNFTLAGGTFIRALGGDGGSATPYQLTDVYGLQGVDSAGMLGYAYVLANNIDASGTTGWNSGAGFDPIGNNGTLFTGVLDGLGHTITGLTINRPSTDYVGLFGAIGSGSAIRNTGLLGGSVTGHNYVGGLAGANNSGTISQAYANGAISGTHYVGGLVGRNNSGTISQAYATGAISGTHYVGGLVGFNFGTINQTYATGAVSGANVVGGLVGYNYYYGTIGQSYATGAVSGDFNIGGLVGYNYYATINQSYATGAVNGTGTEIGGLVGGENGSSSISNSYWDTETSGQSSSAGGSGLTTEAMTDADSFTAWDTDISATGGSNAIWRIYEGHTAPLLRAFMTDAVAVAGSARKTYDGTAFGDYSVDPGAITVTPGFWLPGDTLDASLVLGQAHSDAVNAGSHVLDGTGVYSTQMGYDLDFSGGTLTIDPAALTITTSDVSKTYDGTTSAAGSLVVSSGTLFGSDSMSGGSFVFDDKNAGTGKAVTVSDAIVSDGNSGDNYTVSYVDNTNSTILQRAISAITGITASDKVYDGTTDATVDSSGAAFANIVAGDTLSVATASGVFADKNVGTGKPVAISGLSLGGGDAGNYSLTDTTAGTTAEISQLGITVDATASDKIYDATTAATATLASSGVIVGDDLTFASASSTFADKHAGTNKTVTVSGISASGTDAGNYSFNTTGTDTADISQLGITVDATASDKVYDATTAATTTLASSGVIAGDTVSFASTSSTFDNKSAGVGKTVTVTGINASGTDAGNYAINGSATDTANISQLGITVAVTANDKVYDATTAATTTLASGGILAGDTVSFASTSATFADKNAGVGKNVTVTGISASGADGGNYSVNTSDTDTANIRQLAITVDATASDKVYDATTAATATLASSGVIVGDTVSFVSTSANFDNKNVGTGKTVTATGITASGADAGNYSFNTTDTDLADISQLGITVDATASDKVYDATTAATTTLASSGVLTGDTVSFASTSSTFDNKNVGNGKAVTVTGITAGGADAGNYSVNASDTATAAITPATLTYVADASAFFVGQSPDGLTGNVDGLVGGESLDAATDGTLAWTTPATSDSPTGAYAIDGGGLSAGNYVFVQAPGNAAALTLTHGNAPLAVTSIVAALQPPQNDDDSDDKQTIEVLDITIVDGGVRLP